MRDEDVVSTRAHLLLSNLYFYRFSSFFSANGLYEFLFLDLGALYLTTRRYYL